MRQKIQPPKSLPTPIFIGAKRGTFEESDNLNIDSESEVQMAKNPYKSGGIFDGASHLIFGMAKDLRENMTDAEKVLWFHLRQNPEGFKFRRQHPLGIYIADFYSHKAKLVIEVDGNIHNSSEAKANDDIRQKNIEEGGIKVIRFTNEEIFNDLEIVLQKVQSHLITQ